jgi:hypothetical protein
MGQMRVRRAWAALGVFTLVVGCGGAWLRTHLRPSVSFDADRASVAPDYTTDSAWAALPERVDGADVSAHGERDQQRDARVDAFFVHPTTYFRGEHWNQPLDDAVANERVDRGVLRNQASVLNGSCRVFAPRYRQAILYAFMAQDTDGERARTLAYEDVARAFAEFLRRSGADRPIVIAGHSQGAHHALRLLEEQVAHHALRERLVVAYVIGMPVPAAKFQTTLADVPLCRTPEQIGCVVAYNSVGPEVARDRFENTRVFGPDGYQKNGGSELACVNPLTGRADGELALPPFNLGAVRFTDDDPPRPMPSVGAQCVHGLLEITRPADAKLRITPMGHDDYHLYDYTLFYINLRRDLERRVEAYLAKHPPPAPDNPYAAGH